MNTLNYGIFGRDDLNLAGMTVAEAYEWFHREMPSTMTFGGVPQYKLFIHSFVNGVETSDNPLNDTTIIQPGDEIEFKRIPPPGYDEAKRAKPVGLKTRMKNRLKLMGWL